MSEKSNSSSRIHTLSPGRRLPARALGRLIKLWQHTLVLDGLTAFKSALGQESPGSLVLCWHNRLFPLLSAFQHLNMGQRKVYALMSASRDGALLADFTEFLGMIPIRGSSSRRGSTSALELVKILRSGHHVAITIDGPRGPAYEAKAGASLLVQMTDAPVVLLAAECENCRTLRSWDRFIIPLPFSRVKIKLDRPAFESRLKGKVQRKTIQDTIQKRLSDLTFDLHQQI